MHRGHKSGGVVLCAALRFVVTLKTNLGFVNATYRPCTTLKRCPAFLHRVLLLRSQSRPHRALSRSGGCVGLNSFAARPGPVLTTSRRNLVVSLSLDVNLAKLCSFPGTNANGVIVPSQVVMYQFQFAVSTLKEPKPLLSREGNKSGINAFRMPELQLLRVLSRFVKSFGRNPKPTQSFPCIQLGPVRLAEACEAFG